MNRRNLIILGCCFVFATTVVLTLYAASYKAVHTPNSFLRDYRKFAAIKANELDVEYNSWYIAGVTGEHVYLGNIMAPMRLLVTNLTLTDTQHVRLRIKDTEDATIYVKTRIKIDPPYFYIADGTRPVLFRGKLGEWEAERFMYDKAYFTQATPIGSTSFAIRTNSPATLDNVLGKVRNDTPRVMLDSTLLVKQVDGIFCTDGELLYNKDLNKLVYTYYYRNGFVVYDTGLNLAYRGHTLDTFMQAQIKVGYIPSEKVSKLTYKKTIHKSTSASGSNLFIHSGLLAKNDVADLLDRVAVVDVYDLRNDTYRFSFIVPHLGFEKTKLRDFMVLNNKTLVALHDHHLVRYDLKQEFFADDAREGI
jgi:hypothetical protein